MVLQGVITELSEKLAPNLYQKNTIIDITVEKVLYIDMEGALYGMIKSALLFYLNM